MKRAAVWLILLLLPTRATAEDLQQFLRAATEANRPNVPIRADGEIVVHSPDATTRDKIILIAQTDGDVYIETEKGMKALIHPPDYEVFVRAGKDLDERKVSLEDPFMGGDFTWNDLLPFDASKWEFPVIIDKSVHQLTVQLTPKTAQYVLVVSTFDREKQVPIKTLYYVEKSSNLVKMRTAEDLVEVAGQWLPKKLSMKTFAAQTDTTLTLNWRKAGELPDGLFESSSLERNSGLKFSE